MTEDTPNTPDNPILAKFRAALTDMYGDRLERMVLFGSRARGGMFITIAIMTLRYFCATWTTASASTR